MKKILSVLFVSILAFSLASTPALADEQSGITLEFEEFSEAEHLEMMSDLDDETTYNIPVLSENPLLRGKGIPNGNEVVNAATGVHQVDFYTNESNV